MRRTATSAAVTVVLVLLVTGCGSHADHDELTKARSAMSAAPCGASPAVAGVAGVNGDPRHVYVGDWLIVAVCHLDQFVHAAEAAQAPITLYMEGKDTGNQPVGIDVQSGALTFIVDRTDENRDLWRPFLYNPLFDREVSMRISVGMKGERPLPREPGAHMKVRLQKIYVNWTTWIWMLFLFVFVTLLFAAAAYTDMLRIGPTIGDIRQPYNLGRTQMAWWFFLVVLCYSFIWLVTADRDTIPTSVLGLMGISAGTALAAALIKPKSEQAPRASRGWWRDLVSDENGVVALDRLQIVVWTLVLSGIFLSSVLWELTMPEFNTTLLALMGISSGTYIGFQLPQKTDNTPTITTT